MQNFIALSSLTDWDDVRFFLEAARQGSFRAAAAVLRTTQPTVGRKVESLEARLGVKLFSRVSQGVVLTEAGKRIFGLAEEIERLVRRIEIHGAKEHSLAGRIVLRATDGIGGYWLPPLLVEFHEAYPEIMLEVICGDDCDDLSKLGGDIIVTYERPIHHDLVILAEGRLSFKLHASRSYIKKHGMPRSWGDLANHRLCDHTGYPSFGEWKKWADAVNDSGGLCYRTNSSLALGYVTLYGCGISMQPIGVADRERDIVIIDLDGYSPTLSFWLVCHRDTKDVPRMRALIDYLRISLFREQIQAIKKARFLDREREPPRTTAP